ncbi:hypothetical protein B0A48_06178 [Cryoendolithus antarcticus]|uniref:Uncharacterized protein n=1 Tax=Cryoendolithus antarcticus TaxID=1507870 RepID=A0A1V8TAP7_9PEZI|nr:hypothetical protein B0A48_06178 [Cryoendolithus antarcticus]
MKQILEGKIQRAPPTLPGMKRVALAPLPGMDRVALPQLPLETKAVFSPLPLPPLPPMKRKAQDTTGKGDPKRIKKSCPFPSCVKWDKDEWIAPTTKRSHVKSAHKMILGQQRQCPYESCTTEIELIGYDADKVRILKQHLVEVHQWKEEAIHGLYANAISSGIIPAKSPGLIRAYRAVFAS